MHFCVVFVMRSVTQRNTTAAASCSDKTKRKHPYLLITAPTLVYGSCIIRYHSLECVMYWYPMAGWTAGVTAIFVRGLVPVRMPVNVTCLGYRALVYSTTPIRGNGIGKTLAFCLRLPVHELFIVMIKANTIHDIIKLMV